MRVGMKAKIDKELEDLRALEKRLRKPLEANPAFIRWQAVVAAVRQFEAADAPAAAAPKENKWAAMAERVGKLTHIDYALQALDLKGHPLPTSALVPVMTELGFVMKGKRTTLVQRLSKSKHLEAVVWNGAKGWWPKGKPLPEGFPQAAETEAAGAATND
jgi:hypothetical protein